MSKIEQVISTAVLEIGKPYEYGAEGPAGFDCSGLMQFILQKAGINLPRTAAAQQRALPEVKGEPQAGDLIFYGRPAHHVALYVGEGQVIDAPHTGAKVRHDPIGNYTSIARVPGAGSVRSITGALGDTLKGRAVA